MMRYCIITFSLVFLTLQLSFGQVHKKDEQLLNFEFILDSFIVFNTKAKPYYTPLIIRGDSLKGNIKEITCRYYAVMRNDTFIVYGNCYRYTIKNNKIVETYWFNDSLHPLITNHFYSDFYFPDSTISYNPTNVYNYVSAIKRKINKIDTQGYLYKEIEHYEDGNITVRIKNYDTIGRIITEYIIHSNINNADIQHKNIIYKYKYEYGDMSNKPKITTIFENGILQNTYKKENEMPDPDRKIIKKGIDNTGNWTINERFYENELSEYTIRTIIYN